MSAEDKTSTYENNVTIIMINVVHVKTDVSSAIDIILDRKMKSLEGIVNENIRHKFRVHNEKNKYYLENDFSQVLIMDVLKGLREFGWKLLTSNAFMHFASQKMIETSFYFEKYYAEGSDAIAGSNALQPLLNYYVHSNPQQYEETVEDGRVNFSRSRRASDTTVGLVSRSGHDQYSSPQKPEEQNNPSVAGGAIISPHLASMLLEKDTVQSGPYGFMRRQSNMNVPNRLKQERHPPPNANLSSPSREIFRPTEEEKYTPGSSAAQGLGRHNTLAVDGPRTPAPSVPPAPPDSNLRHPEHGDIYPDRDLVESLAYTTVPAATRASLTPRKAITAAAVAQAAAAAEKAAIEKAKYEQALNEKRAKQNQTLDHPPMQQQHEHYEHHDRYHLQDHHHAQQQQQLPHQRASLGAAITDEKLSVDAPMDQILHHKRASAPPSMPNHVHHKHTDTPSPELFADDRSFSSIDAKAVGGGDMSNAGSPIQPTSSKIKKNRPVALDAEEANTEAALLGSVSNTNTPLAGESQPPTPNTLKERIARRASLTRPTSFSIKKTESTDSQHGGENSPGGVVLNKTSQPNNALSPHNSSANLKQQAASSATNSSVSASSVPVPARALSPNPPAPAAASTPVRSTDTAPIKSDTHTPLIKTPPKTNAAANKLFQKYSRRPSQIAAPAPAPTQTDRQNEENKPAQQQHTTNPSVEAPHQHQHQHHHGHHHHDQQQPQQQPPPPPLPPPSQDSDSAPESAAVPQPVKRSSLAGLFGSTEQVDDHHQQQQDDQLKNDQLHGHLAPPAVPPPPPPPPAAIHVAPPAPSQAEVAMTATRDDDAPASPISDHPIDAADFSTKGAGEFMTPNNTMDSEKVHIASLSSVKKPIYFNGNMLQGSKDEAEFKKHQENQVNHHSKLGGVFKNENALLAGRGGAGRGGTGRGLSAAATGRGPAASRPSAVAASPPTAPQTAQQSSPPPPPAPLVTAPEAQAELSMKEQAQAAALEKSKREEELRKVAEREAEEKAAAEAAARRKEAEEAEAIAMADAQLQAQAQAEAELAAQAAQERAQGEQWQPPKWEPGVPGAPDAPTPPVITTTSTVAASLDDPSPEEEQQQPYSDKMKMPSLNEKSKPVYFNGNMLQSSKDEADFKKHQENQANHLSKLGGVFKNENALMAGGRGGRGRGRGRGSGLSPTK